MSVAPYSLLVLDQSMTATGWAHMRQGDKGPSGGLFSLPAWGDDQGPHIVSFANWLLGMVEERGVTHLGFEEPVNPHDLDHRETFSELMASWGLPTIIEMVAYEAGIPADNRLMVPIKEWRNRFWGTERAPKHWTKSARRSWLKERSLQACAERGWLVDDHNVADAHGILDHVLSTIDPVYESRSGPLFRRAQSRADNEKREFA